MFARAALTAVALAVVVAALTFRASTNLSPDETFLLSHRTGALPFAQWTHQAHIRLAFLVHASSKHNRTQTLATVTADIQRFNARHASKLMVGYHATLTKFWVDAVATAVEAPAAEYESFGDFWASTRAILGDSRLWQRYYTRATMFCAEAKAAYIAPDLRPIPSSWGAWVPFSAK